MTEARGDRFVDLAGKVALVTGGGTGIGAACARVLARAGARVAVMGRRHAPLDEVARAIDGLALVADAADAAAVRGALAALDDWAGRLDIVIACAGGHGFARATDTDDQAWAASIDANLNSAFVVARETLPRLCARRGNLLLVSSIAGLAAGPQVCGYTTTKHALIGLMRSLARDYGPQGVRVNAICPGWVRTPMADEEMQLLMKAHGIDLDAAYARATADVPLRRAAAPDEIAAACCFLVSDAASIITGAVLVADGGATVVDVPTLAFAHLP